MSRKGLNREISRRSLLQAAGVMGAGWLLASCGSSQKTPAAAPAAGSAPAAPAAAAPAAAAQPAKLTGEIVFSNYEWNDPGLADRWLRVVEPFLKANPDIKLNKQAVPSTQYWDKMLTETVAGAPVDLYYNTGWRLPQLIEAGALEPFDNHCDTKLINDSFFPGQKAELVKDGKTYGIMVGSTIVAMYYNKRILEENKVAVPKTIEELFEAARKLTKAPNQYGLGLPTINATQLMEPVMNFVIGLGGHFAKDGKPTATDPKTIAGLRWYKKFVDAGVTPMGQNNPTLRPLMWSGKMAFWMDGAWFTGMVEQNKGEALKDLNTTMLPFPTGAGRTAVQCLTMPKSAPNKKNAGALIDWMVKPDMQLAMLEGSKILPGRDKGADYSPFVSKNPWYKAFLDQAKNTVPHTPPGFEKIGAEYEKVVRDNVSDMIARNLEVEKVAEKIQKELEALIKKA